MGRLSMDTEDYEIKIYLARPMPATPLAAIRFFFKYVQAASVEMHGQADQEGWLKAEARRLAAAGAREHGIPWTSLVMNGVRKSYKYRHKVDYVEGNVKKFRLYNRGKSVL